MRTVATALLALPWFLQAGVAPPDLLDDSTALEMTGESLSVGQARAVVCAAPGAPKGTYSLKLTFRLRHHRARNWLDVACPSLLDLSASDKWRLWVRAEQPAAFLNIKVVDPDNPPPNHSVLEGPLLDGKSPLPAGKWVPLVLSFPGKPTLRDRVTYLGFYISTADRRVPLDRDVVFYVGRFSVKPVKRPAWPPRRSGGQSGRWKTIWDGPLAAGSGWQPVSGKDNQTDHAARFEAGGVEFDADADGWNEFLWSDPARVRFRPKTTYRLRFDYTVLRAPSGPKDAGFYSLCRARGTIREDVGWQRWQGSAGTRGTRVCTFTTHDFPGYFLIFGVRHRGGIRIDRIRIEERRAP